MPEAIGRDPQAQTELASTAEDLAAVSRDRDSQRHQLADAGGSMSEVSAARDALQQKMMGLTQERRSVLTDRHVEDRNAHPASTAQRTVDCPSAASFAAKYTGRGVTRSSRLPTDACVNADGEKRSPSQNRAFVLGR